VRLIINDGGIEDIEKMVILGEYIDEIYRCPTR
jgi:hypothetical protein